MGERNGARSGDLRIPASPRAGGGGGADSNHSLNRPSEAASRVSREAGVGGKGWRRVCMQGRGDPAESFAAHSAAASIQEGTTTAKQDPETWQGGTAIKEEDSQVNQRHLKVSHGDPKTNSGGSAKAHKGPSVAHYTTPHIVVPPYRNQGDPHRAVPFPTTSIKVVPCDAEQDFSRTEEFNEDENFAAQPPVEKCLYVHPSENGLMFAQELSAKPSMWTSMKSSHLDWQALMLDGDYEPHSRSGNPHLAQSPLCIESSKPQVPTLSMINSSQSSSTILKSSNRSHASPSQNHSSKRMANPPLQSRDCSSSRSKRSSHSPRKSASHSSNSMGHSSSQLSSQAKKHSPEKKTTHSSQSKNHSPLKRTSRSHSSQSKNHSPVKKISLSPCSSRSRDGSPMKRTSRSYSPWGKTKRLHSRSNSISPFRRTSNLHSSQSSKRTSRSRSPRSRNRSPSRRTSRLHSPHSVKHSTSKITSRSLSTRSRSRTPTMTKASRLRILSLQSRSRTPTMTRASRLRLLTARSRSPSPLRLTDRLCLSRSRSISPVTTMATGLHSSRSRSHSPSKRTNRLHTSRSESIDSHMKRISRSRSRNRSPLARTGSQCSSHSRNRSPVKRTSRSRSRNRSPVKGTSRLHSSRSRSHSPSKQNSTECSFGVRVDISTSLPDDKTLKEVIFQRFVKFGFVTSVEVHHSSKGRYILVYYDQQHEQQEALVSAPKTRLYSKKIEVSPWTGRKIEESSGTNVWDDENTKFNPASTRTLLIENLAKAIAPEKLDNICVKFDDILDIEIQQEPEKSTCSALVEFCSITSLIKAGKALNRKFFGTSQVKVTFAKSVPTNCLWLDGLPTNLTLDYLILRFSEYGPVAKTLYDCVKGMGLVFYKHDKDAITAMKELKCGLGKVSGHRVMVDFANDRTRVAFCQSMEASGQKIGDFLSD